MDTNKRIFPAEIIENSVEKHFEEYNPRSRRLYLAVLGALFLAFILMFIIRVDVSVRSSGIIRPIQERTDIRPPVEGVVDSIFVSENQHVVSGQPLMKIRSQAVDEQTMALSTQASELTAQVADLKALLDGRSDSLSSSLYTQQYVLYKEKLLNAQTKFDVVSKEYSRYAQLYKGRVISPAEFEKYDFQRRTASNELNMVREQQRSIWQADLNRLSVQLRDLDARTTMYNEQKSLYTVKATVTGTIQQLKGIQPGSFVSPNEAVGEISPDSGLIAETYVMPKNIGLLQPGTKVRMQVDAFDYNVWGMIPGVVQSVSSDVFTNDGMPFFKVRCQLNTPYLKLRNGYKGQIKKGMTIQARFLVTRRSLYQLIYDQADDWLDPNQTKKQNAPATAKK